MGEFDLVDLRGRPGVRVFNTPVDSDAGVPRTQLENLCILTP